MKLKKLWIILIVVLVLSTKPATTIDIYSNTDYLSYTRSDPHSCLHPTEIIIPTQNVINADTIFFPNLYQPTTTDSRQ